MTISTTTSVVTFQGDGIVTNFAITWDRVDTTNDADVRVILRDESVTPPTETLQTNPAEYSLSGNTVVMVTAPGANERLIIKRAQTDIQPTDLLNNASFQAETLETSLDRITALVQQNSEDLNQALRVTETSTEASTAFDPAIPEPEASQFLRMKADLTGFELVSASDITGSGGTDHSTLSNLSADDHTQYALLAGRSGGQTLHGGSAASNNLVLESTDNASEGQIIVRDTTAIVLEPSGAADDTPLVLRFREDTANGSNFIGLQAPSSIGASVTFTLPDTDGVNGEVLQTNGSGVLSFVSVSPSDHGTLTGLLDDDHTQYLLLAGRTGGQEIFGGIDDGSALVLKATNSAVQGDVEVRESLSLSLFPHGLLGADVTELRFYESGNPPTNFVGFEAPTALAGDQIWVLPLADGTNGQALVTDGSGNLSFAAAGGVAASIDINSLAAETPVGGDEFLFGDISDSNSNKKVTLTNLVTAINGIGVTDNDAIHDNVAGEIILVTEKATPVSADVILIEDSADTNNKKRVQIGNLPAGAASSLDIASLTTEVPATGDLFVFDDVSDSNNNKKVTLDNLLDNSFVNDQDAIHDNVASEISAITAKATPVGADFILIEDSADSNNKKSVTLTNLLDNAVVNDQDAIHDNVASEISAITAKGTPTAADFLLIEDAADSNNKKRITIGDLPGGGGGGGISSIDARTADFTIPTVDGSVAYTNDGASGEVIATVPAATAADNFWASVVDAQNFRFESTGGDTFVFPDSGLSGITQFESSTVGSTIYAVAVDANTWHMFVDEGTWAQAFDAKLFMASGDNSGFQNVHESYEFNTWSSEAVTSPFDPGDRASQTGFSSAATFYHSFGTRTGAGANSNLNHEYSISGDSWTARATDTGRSEAASAAAGTEMFVFADQTVGTTTDRYDTVGNSWTNRGALITGKGNCSNNGAGDGTDVYLLGGNNGAGTGESSDIQQFSVAGNSWSTQTGTVTAVLQQKTSSVGTDIFSGGGQVSGPAVTTTIQDYDTVGDSVSTATATLGTARRELGGGSIGTLVYFTAGDTNPGVSNLHDEFDSVGDTVTARATKTTSVEECGGDAA